MNTFGSDLPEVTPRMDPANNIGIDINTSL